MDGGENGGIGPVEDQKNEEVEKESQEESRKEEEVKDSPEKTAEIKEAAEELKTAVETPEVTLEQKDFQEPEKIEAEIKESISSVDDEVSTLPVPIPGPADGEITIEPPPSEPTLEAEVAIKPGEDLATPEPIPGAADEIGQVEVMEAARKAQEGPGAAAEKADAPVAEAEQAAAAVDESDLDGKGGDSLTMEIGKDAELKPDLDRGVEQVTDLHKPTDTKDALDLDGAMSGDQIGEGVGLQDADRADDLMSKGKESPLEGLGKGGESGIPGFEGGGIHQESGSGGEGAHIDPEKLDKFGEQLGDKFGLHEGPGGGPPEREIPDLPGQGDMEGWEDRPDLKGAAEPGADPTISADDEKTAEQIAAEKAAKAAAAKAAKAKAAKAAATKAAKAKAAAAKKKHDEAKGKGPVVLDKETAMASGGQKKTSVKVTAGRIMAQINKILGIGTGDTAPDGHVGTRGTQDPEGGVATYTDIPPGVTADPMDTPLDYSDSMMQPAGEDSGKDKPRENLKEKLAESKLDPYTQHHGDEVDVPEGMMGSKVDVDGNLIDPPDIAGGGEDFIAADSSKKNVANTEDEANLNAVDPESGQKPTPQ